MAQSVALKTKKSVVIFSLEMSRQQLALRLLSSTAEIDNKILMTGRLSQTDWSKLIEAGAALSEVKMFINDNPMMTVADMNAQCRRVDNLGLIVIDYLQLMTGSGSKKSGFTSENRVNVMSDISRMIKVMAKELNVPVIALSQLSRDSEKRAEKRPMLSDLRESGSIEQDADIVLGLYREEYFDDETENGNIAELIILKNRRGETGKIQLLWSPQYTRYSSLERKYDEEGG